LHVPDVVAGKIGVTLEVVNVDQCCVGPAKKYF
jgi:hypothetical protein